MKNQLAKNKIKKLYNTFKHTNIKLDLNYSAYTLIANIHIT